MTDTKSPNRSRRVLRLLKIVIAVAALVAVSVGAIALDKEQDEGVARGSASAELSVQVASTAHDLWALVAGSSEATKDDSAPCAIARPRQ